MMAAIPHTQEKTMTREDAFSLALNILAQRGEPQSAAKAMRLAVQIEKFCNRATDDSLDDVLAAVEELGL